jgi:hypothetical protein
MREQQRSSSSSILLLPILRSSFKLAVVRIAAFTFWVLQAMSIVALA